MLDENRKLQSLIKLSDCCKILKKYSGSLKFLRKALQYAWNLRADDLELMIYDKLGMIYFLIGDIIKAKYYHERFMENKLESDKSPCKHTSQEILAKIFEINNCDNYNIFTSSSSQIIPMILAKLSITMQINDKNNIVFSRKSGVFEDNNEKNSFFYSANQNNCRPTIPFTTDINADIQLEGIFAQKEFLFEISSPRCEVSLKKLYFYLINRPKI